MCEIRRASPNDATSIGLLIRSLSGPFLQSPSGAGAEAFFASISEDSIRGYLSSGRFCYFVAIAAGTLAGVAAIRDGSHLYHLFVAPGYQRNGLARALWDAVRIEAMSAGNPGDFTVNSSVSAVAVYEKFGFSATAPVTRVNGVVFVPMRLERSIES